MNKLKWYEERLNNAYYHLIREINKTYAYETPYVIEAENFNHAMEILEGLEQEYYKLNSKGVISELYSILEIFKQWKEQGFDDKEEFKGCVLLVLTFEKWFIKKNTTKYKDICNDFYEQISALGLYDHIRG